jgi:hypothetical protein
MLSDNKLQCIRDRVEGKENRDDLGYGFAIDDRRVLLAEVDELRAEIARLKFANEELVKT